MKFLINGNLSAPMPHPPQMSNHGNYIISLSRFTSWLAEQAEELGVEVYPGFAGASPVYTEDGTGVKGVCTGDVGLDKNMQPKDSFEPGMEFHAKVTLIAEGAHGSLSKVLQNKFNLRDGVDPQTYGLGIKEVWKVRDEVHEPGKIIHTLGWPLDMHTYGGSFLYHMEDNMVTLGLVVGLDYKNPYISPFREFQRLKHHPVFAEVLKGGECIAYGARALNEGGYQSIPKLFFPGGALIGCSAGFLNVPKIKGTHNAMKSGMLAAEAAFEQLTKGEESEEPVDMSGYAAKMEDSWVYKELKEVRNLRPSFHNPLGLWGGMAYSGLDSMILKGRVPWTFHHPEEDYAATKPAANFTPIEYPKPDGEISFDILTSVARTGTNHAEGQPVHLRLPTDKDARKRHTETNVTEYDGLLGRVCPAAVYEYQDAEGADVDAVGKKFVINSQNCIHCKTCSIKVPTQDITWTVPEGGGGPKYSEFESITIRARTPLTRSHHLSTLQPSNPAQNAPNLHVLRVSRSSASPVALEFLLKARAVTAGTGGEGRGGQRTSGWGEGTRAQAQRTSALLCSEPSLRGAQTHTHAHAHSSQHCELKGGLTSPDVPHCWI
jgi:electron-transferring-flavoprotein dehydrogenase